MNDNDTNNMDTNSNLHNGDISSGIGLINIHTLLQDGESSNLNNK